MSGNSRERRRQARALRQQQPPPSAPDPSVAEVQPPSFRSVLLQDGVPTSVTPMASRLSSLCVTDLPSSGSNTLHASGTTPVHVGGLDALQRIVDGSVSTAQVGSDIPPVEGDSGVLPAFLPNISVHPPPLEGGLHHVVNADPVSVQVMAYGRSSGDRDPGGVPEEGVAQGGTQSSRQDDTFVSAQEILSAQTILYDPAWRTQRWEHHRLLRCARFGLQPHPTIPLADRLGNMPSDTRVLPYGIRRTSIGTWVTTTMGQSAFYPRRAMEYDEWDLDEDRNSRPSFP